MKFKFYSLNITYKIQDKCDANDNKIKRTFKDDRTDVLPMQTNKSLEAFVLLGCYTQYVGSC